MKISSNMCRGWGFVLLSTDAPDTPAPEEVYHRPAQTYPGCFGLPYQVSLTMLFLPLII